MYILQIPIKFFRKNVGYAREYPGTTVGPSMALPMASCASLCLCCVGVGCLLSSSLLIGFYDKYILVEPLSFLGVFFEKKIHIKSLAFLYFAEELY